jgi:hypothetical protein
MNRRILVIYARAIEVSCRPNGKRGKQADVDHGLRCSIESGESSGGCPSDPRGTACSADLGERDDGDSSMLAETRRHRVLGPNYR